MKMYKKSKLTYKNGYVLKDSKVIGIDNEIVDKLNELEVELQKAMWDVTHPVKPVEPQPEFQFETERGKIYAYVEPKTDHLDKMVEETMAIMADIDNIGYANDVNAKMDELVPVIQFANDKRVLSLDQPEQHRFDLKYIGNPLELTKGDVLNIVKAVCNV